LIKGRVTLPEPWGGQGLSATIGTFVGEMLSSSNPALSKPPVRRWRI
jgi:hypothetical protein